MRFVWDIFPCRLLRRLANNYFLVTPGSLRSPGAIILSRAARAQSVRCLLYDDSRLHTLPFPHSRENNSGVTLQDMECELLIALPIVTVPMSGVVASAVTFKLNARLQRRDFGKR